MTPHTVEIKIREGATWDAPLSCVLPTISPSLAEHLAQLSSTQPLGLAVRPAQSPPPGKHLGATSRVSCSFVPRLCGALSSV